MRIALAQVNPTVGDLEGNAHLILSRAEEAYQAEAKLVAFPELAVCGYPPEDLLLKDHFLTECRDTLVGIAKACPRIVALVGVPWLEDGVVFNSAAVLAGGSVVAIYRKICLPNYGVFDEKRYFQPGDRVLALEVDGSKVGVNICEDIWEKTGPTLDAALAADARLVINLSMSPYHLGKGKEREEMLSQRAGQAGVYICYLNGVGGQDELVFDGQSMVFDPQGRLMARARQFEEQLLLVDVDLASPPVPGRTAMPTGRWPVEVVTIEAASGASSTGTTTATAAATPVSLVGQAEGDLPPSSGFSAVMGQPELSADEVGPSLTPEAEVYQALCLGVSDYVNKNGFGHVVLGMSGGIDSALTACIAADALGKERVIAVSMPSRYSSAGTRDDARETAARLGIEFFEIPIESMFQAYLKSLHPYFADNGTDVTEQNIQARIRGNVLMALSNKFGWLVLTTGNKSEMAVGYATLYGDMAGGFGVLKDVPKTLVYRLSSYRNSLGSGDGPIPESTIERAPSAELAPNQTDQDTLPPYEVLDEIVDAYVVKDESVEEIVARGIDRSDVERVVAMVDGNEYKRRQAPPGVRITPKGFGKDRRLPMTNRYRG